MKSSKTGFFRKLIISMTDMRLYPLILKESIFSALGFFCKLVLLFSIILSIGITADFFDAIPEYVEAVENKFPDFEINNGIFSSTEPVDAKISSYLYICTKDARDIEFSGDSIINTEDFKQVVFAVINESSIDLYRKGDKSSYMKFGQVVLPKAGEIDKQELVSYWNDFEESYLARLFVLMAFTISLFVVYGMYRCWFLLFYMTTIFFVNFIFFNKLRFRDYIKISIYISGLPVILELLSFCIAKFLPEGAAFIIMLISTLYTYYALKTIKLDSILLTAFGDTPEEKIVNAITKAQEELQRQINELEAEEKRKQELKDKKNHENSKDNNEDDNNDENKGDH